jgi:hypothetical protein
MHVQYVLVDSSLCLLCSVHDSNSMAPRRHGIGRRERPLSTVDYNNMIAVAAWPGPGPGVRQHMGWDGMHRMAPRRLRLRPPGTCLVLPGAWLPSFVHPIGRLACSIYLECRSMAMQCNAMQGRGRQAVRSSHLKLTDACMLSNLLVHWTVQRGNSCVAKMAESLICGSSTNIT